MSSEPGERHVALGRAGAAVGVAVVDVAHVDAADLLEHEPVHRPRAAAAQPDGRRAGDERLEAAARQAPARLRRGVLVEHRDGALRRPRSTMLGSSQHHHHQGKSSRIAGLDSLRRTSCVRSSSCTSGDASTLLAVNASPRTSSSKRGRATASCGACSRSRPPTASVCSMLSMTWRMSRSHHHGQQYHQNGQHGQQLQQQKQRHQLKDAVKCPVASVVTVAAGRPPVAEDRVPHAVDGHVRAGHRTAVGRQQHAADLVGPAPAPPQLEPRLAQIDLERAEVDPTLRAFSTSSRSSGTRCSEPTFSRWSSKPGRPDHQRQAVGARLLELARSAARPAGRPSRRSAPTRAPRRLARGTPQAAPRPRVCPAARGR